MIFPDKDEAPAVQHRQTTIKADSKTVRET